MVTPGYGEEPYPDIAGDPSRAARGDASRPPAGTAPAEERLAQAARIFAGPEVYPSSVLLKAGLELVERVQVLEQGIRDAASALAATFTGGHAGSKGHAARRLDSQVAAVRRSLRALVPLDRPGPA